MRKWRRSSSTTVLLLVLLVTMHLALCWHFTLLFHSCRQAQDFRYHGRFGQDAFLQPVVIPQVQFLDKFDVQFWFVVPAECRHGPDSAENRGVLHAVPDRVVGLPVVCNDSGGLVQTLSLEVPQLQLFYKDVDLPVVAQRLFPWSRLSAEH